MVIESQRGVCEMPRARASVQRLGDKLQVVWRFRTVDRREAVRASVVDDVAGVQAFSRKVVEELAEVDAATFDQLHLVTK